MRPALACTLILTIASALRPPPRKRCINPSRTALQALPAQRVGLAAARIRFAAQWPLYATIPLCAGLFNALTNKLAVTMMFFPIRRRGFKLLGWQGVVPKAARRMGGDVSDLLTKDLLNVTEVLSRVDPETLSQRLCTPALVELGKRLVKDEVELAAPLVTPDLVKRVIQRCVARVQDDVDAFVRAASPLFGASEEPWTHESIKPPATPPRSPDGDGTDTDPFPPTPPSFQERAATATAALQRMLDASPTTPPSPLTNCTAATRLHARDAAAAAARFRFDHHRSQTVPRPLRRPRGEGLGRRAAGDDVNNFISCEAATQVASHVVHDAARDRELFAQLPPARHGYYYAAVVYELSGADVLLNVYCILFCSHQASIIACCGND